MDCKYRTCFNNKYYCEIKEDLQKGSFSNYEVMCDFDNCPFKEKIDGITRNNTSKAKTNPA